MANEGGNNEVGSISFGIRADTTQFVADLKRAEQAAKQTSQVIGQEAKVIQTSMTGPNLAGVAPGGFMVGPGLGGGGSGGGRAGGGGSAAASAASAASAAAVASVAGAMGNGARDAARF